MDTVSPNKCRNIVNTLRDTRPEYTLPKVEGQRLFFVSIYYTYAFPNVKMCQCNESNAI